MTTRRFMDFNPVTGIETWWEEGEGYAGQRLYGDVSGVLDMNLEAQNHCNPNSVEKDIRMVARVPAIIKAVWRNEYGIDYDNPDHQEAVNKLLNDSDWYKLRTDRSHL